MQRSNETTVAVNNSMVQRMILQTYGKRGVYMAFGNELPEVGERCKCTVISNEKGKLFQENVLTGRVIKVVKCYGFIVFETVNSYYVLSSMPNNILMSKNFPGIGKKLVGYNVFNSILQTSPLAQMYRINDSYIYICATRNHSYIVNASFAS